MQTLSVWMSLKFVIWERVKKEIGSDLKGWPSGIKNCKLQTSLASSASLKSKI